MEEIDKLLDFVQKNLIKYNDRELLREIIKKHQEFGTCDYGLTEDGEIDFFVRYNINGNDAFIIDLVIKNRCKSISIMREAIRKGFKKFTYLKTITFERGLKEFGFKGKRTYLVKKGA